MYVVFFFKIVHNKRVDTIIRAVAREYQNFIRAVARGTRPPSLGKDVFFYIKDTFNKLGYKAEINNYTASRIN